MGVPAALEARSFPPKLASLLRHRVIRTWTPPDAPGRICTRCEEHVVGMAGLDPGRGFALRVLGPVLYLPHVGVMADFTPYSSRVASQVSGVGIRVPAAPETDSEGREWG